MQIFPTIEGTNAVYTSQLLDETGTPIPGATLTAAVLTFYDRLTGAIVNGRSAQNVLNANNVVIDGSGNLTWTMPPADHPVLATGRPTPSAERHIAFFTFTWPTGALEHNVAFDVAKQRVSGT